MNPSLPRWIPFALLFLRPHPVEKALAHYVFSGSQASAAAMEWEPQAVSDASGAQSPALPSRLPAVTSCQPWDPASRRRRWSRRS